MNIEDVEGIGPVHAATLRGTGVHTTDHLLERGATPEGRETLAATSGISHKLILEWVNHADLMRIEGVGSEYADLLEAGGVDSPAELAHRTAENLATTLEELNVARATVRRVPSAAVIQGWIDQSKKLPRVVSH